jgi:hypothetical protein
LVKIYVYRKLTFITWSNTRVATVIAMAAGWLIPPRTSKGISKWAKGVGEEELRIDIHMDGYDSTYLETNYTRNEWER